MVGRTYLERGHPVVVLVGWGPGGGPRNVMIRREDGTVVVRPFRGLRRDTRGMDLIEFVLRRLAADERVIAAAAEGYFYADGHSRDVNRWFERWSPDNPNAMLDEIRVKRLVIAEHTPRAAGYCCPVCWEGAEAGHPVDAPCRTVLLIAQMYAGQEGWRPEWALRQQEET